MSISSHLISSHLIYLASFLLCILINGLGEAKDFNLLKRSKKMPNKIIVNNSQLLKELQRLDCDRVMKKYPEAKDCREAEQKEFGEALSGSKFDKIPTRKDSLKALEQQKKGLGKEIRQSKAEIEKLQKQRDEIQAKIDAASAERSKIDSHLRPIDKANSRYLNEGDYATSDVLGVSHELPEGVTQEDVNNLRERRDQQTEIIHALIEDRSEVDGQIIAAEEGLQQSESDLAETNADLKDGQGSDGGITIRERFRYMPEGY